MDVNYLLIVTGVVVFLIIILILVILLLFAKKKLIPSGNVKLTINGDRELGAFGGDFAQHASK